jgi:hypothetical protein
MIVRGNKPRQMLAVAKFLGDHADETLLAALSTLTNIIDEGSSPQRMLGLVATLPLDVIEQSNKVLGRDALAPYMPEVDRVAGHFQTQSFSNRCADWGTVFDRPVQVALSALADMIDIRCPRPSSTTRSDGFYPELEALIMSLRFKSELDEPLRHYLLSVVLHLRQMLEHLDLFGTDSILDLQGRFITDVLLLVPDDQVHVAKDGSGKTSPVQKVWKVLTAASVLVGLPVNVFGAVEALRALSP